MTENEIRDTFPGLCTIYNFFTNLNFDPFLSMAIWTLYRIQGFLGFWCTWFDGLIINQKWQKMKLETHFTPKDLPLPPVRKTYTQPQEGESVLKFLFFNLPHFEQIFHPPETKRFLWTSIDHHMTWRLFHGFHVLIINQKWHKMILETHFTLKSFPLTPISNT